ncbi:hypothetical protein DPMN_169420 [Dreissena polymorpha]|uniref:Uncharacterized protein n=1 Tax=Dreissena polymorpha TaxID=45954 RepID=A0A9D4DW06_DREPO|nr:hypothetical protein DPMN_169420 [Dreissena polymorpha]
MACTQLSRLPVLQGFLPNLCYRFGSPNCTAWVHSSTCTTRFSPLPVLQDLPNLYYRNCPNLSCRV